MKKLWGRVFGARVRCDRCRKLYRPNLADQPKPDGSLDRRFICPHCGVEVVVAHITLRGRVLMAELQNTRVTDVVRIRELRKLIKKEVTRP